MTSKTLTQKWKACRKEGLACWLHRRGFQGNCSISMKVSSQGHPRGRITKCVGLALVIVLWRWIQSQQQSIPFCCQAMSVVGLGASFAQEGSRVPRGTPLEKLRCLFYALWERRTDPWRPGENAMWPPDLLVSVCPGVQGFPWPIAMSLSSCGAVGQAGGLAAWLPSCDLVPVTLGHMASSSGNRWGTAGSWLFWR